MDTPRHMFGNFGGSFPPTPGGAFSGSPFPGGPFPGHPGPSFPRHAGPPPSYPGSLLLILSVGL